jgi:hypothetical protein
MTEAGHRVDVIRAGDNQREGEARGAGYEVAGGFALIDARRLVGACSCLTFRTLHMLAVL